MRKNIENAAKAVGLMDSYLRDKFSGKNGEAPQEKKIWENTYIYHQIEGRKDGHVFTISEHIRGMIYSMLSSGVSWDRIAKEIDISTGRIIPVDDVFGKYDPETLVNSEPRELCNAITEKNCNGRFTEKQMEGLLMNIPKLQAIDKEYRGIDNFYNSIIGTEGSGLKKLIQTLSGSGSKYKMAQLGEALTSEYLRNVGYDIPKPDTHIRRILGRGILGCSDAETVSVFEAFDIISEIAQVMNWPLAKVDYILWSYCADGYGEICTVHPKCDQCIANKVSEYCVKGKNYGSKEKNSNENLYLLFCNYGIKPNDSCPEIIKKVAYKSFASFCRRISFYDSASLDERNKAVKDTDELLAERIPVFLKAVQTENDSQEFFDQKHKELCGEMIQLFEPAGGLTYGIAQRWLNQTLQNLTVVDCNMPVASLPVADTKKYYHVPVEPAVLSVAAGKRKGRFEHELCIPCAPLKHNEPMVYQMDWYVSGRMQPFEKWEYPEYMDFQKAVRNRLAELASSQDGAFMTPLDWAFCAALEAAQPRYSL